HWLAALAAVRLALRMGLRAGFAAAIGLLFALHPVQVQSVAWAASINDPLLGLFSLVALNAHLAWLQERKRGSLVLALVAFALGLLSKEQVVAVLPIAFGMGLWQGGMDWRARLREMAPMAAVLAVYLGLRMYVFGSWTAGLGGAIVEFKLTFWRGIQFRGELLGTFGEMLAWPMNLPFFRGVQPEVPAGDSRVFLAALLACGWILSIPYCLWKGHRRTALLLAIPVIWLGPQILAYESAGAFPQSDRYLYLPVFAFAALLVGLLNRMGKPAWLPIPVIAIACLYGVQSHRLLAPYKDNITFFRSAVAESPTVPVGYWSLGRELLAEYKRDKDVARLREALLLYWQCLILGHDYEERAPKLGPEATVEERLAELEPLLTGGAVKVKPDPTVMVSLEDRFQGNMGQGWVFLAMGELPPQYDHHTAIEVFTQITTGFPDRHEAWIGLGMAYLSASQFEKAEEAVAKAIQANRVSPDAWFALGEVLRQKGDFRGARNAYLEAQKYRVGGTQDRLAAIRCSLDSDDLNIAEAELKTLVEDHGEDPEVQYLQGMLAARRGQWPSALDHFDRVLVAEPLNTLAHLQRGKVLVQLGQTTEAIAAFGRVCELDSTHFEAHSLIGTILLQDPQTVDQARQYLQRAYGLGVPGVARSRVQSQLLEWFKDDENALLAYMHMDEGRGDYEACLFWVEALLRIEKPWKDYPDRVPRMATVFLTNGNCLRALGEQKRAVAAFIRSLQLQEDQFWTQFNLGELLVQMEQPANALPHLNRAMELIDQVPTKEGLRNAVRTTVTRIRDLAQSLAPDPMGPPLAP
ncbi:MAG: tetratricopeptide repeat protein, partial [Planctomycetes bacterium]|nr:tetratricopeptide repeat protein [Planctomycetota bacterium]